MTQRVRARFFVEILRPAAAERRCRRRMRGRSLSRRQDPSPPLRGPSPLRRGEGSRRGGHRETSAPRAVHLLRACEEIERTWSRQFKHAGGVPDISRWRAPKARCHRLTWSRISDPGRGRGKPPAPRWGARFGICFLRWRRAFRRAIGDRNVTLRMPAAHRAHRFAS